MKQLIQNLKNGELSLADIPTPKVGHNEILIRNTMSLISTGTEKMLLEFGKSNVITKARSQPEKVNEVINKIKKDGLIATYDAVNAKLSAPMPLGYSSIGIVVSVGDSVQNFKAGDRVTSNGSHAEFVCVPKNLVAKIPHSVADEDAVFTVIASIALQGIRLQDPKIGETIVVYGLGLVGLITCEILIANGCKVIGIDISEDRLAIAETVGVNIINGKHEEKINHTVMSLTDNYGADGVIITTATQSNFVIKKSADICRKRGKITLVGIAGLNLNRGDFFKKELKFQVSCSYGPGRYDNEYEEKGNDYPYAFVRWTENRNFQAVLGLLSSKKISLKKYLEKTYEFKDFSLAYETVANSSILGVGFKYNVGEIKNEITTKNYTTTVKNIISNTDELTCLMVGAGGYATKVIIPSLIKNGVNIKSIVSKSGLAASSLAKKYNIEYVSSNALGSVEAGLENLVVIATPHDSHAQLIEKALQSGKNVFCEKPLAINKKQLLKVSKAILNKNDLYFLVGFNRRFSKHIISIKNEISGYEAPKHINYNIHAGPIPADNWVNDVKVGGGRIIGEVCHFIDLVKFIIGRKVIDYNFSKLYSGNPEYTGHLILVMCFDDGSIANINYITNSSIELPKEDVHIHFSGKTILMNNFHKTTFLGFGKKRVLRTLRQDKGQQEMFKQLIDCLINSRADLIDPMDIIETTRISIEIENGPQNS